MQDRQNVSSATKQQSCRKRYKKEKDRQVLTFLTTRLKKTLRLWKQHLALPGLVIITMFLTSCAPQLIRTSPQIPVLPKPQKINLEHLTWIEVKDQQCLSATEQTKMLQNYVKIQGALYTLTKQVLYYREAIEKLKKDTQ